MHSTAFAIESCWCPQRTSHAACVIMSHMSSCRADGNIVICSTKASVHAAFRATYQSPACHSGAAANMRANGVRCPYA